MKCHDAQACALSQWNAHYDKATKGISKSPCLNCEAGKEILAIYRQLYRETFNRIRGIDEHMTPAVIRSIGGFA